MEKVFAYSVDDVHIKYVCDKCSSYHYKNGRLRKNPKLVLHKHGSDRDLSNRIENRGAGGDHCPLRTGNIDIEINDNTIRC